MFRLSLGLVKIVPRRRRRRRRARAGSFLASPRHPQRRAVDLSMRNLVVVTWPCQERKTVVGTWNYLFWSLPTDISRVLLSVVVTPPTSTWTPRSAVLLASSSFGSRFPCPAESSPFSRASTSASWVVFPVPPAGPRCHTSLSIVTIDPSSGKCRTHRATNLFRSSRDFAHCCSKSRSRSSDTAISIVKSKREPATSTPSIKTEPVLSFIGAKTTWLRENSAEDGRRPGKSNIRTSQRVNHKDRRRTLLSPAGLRRSKSSRSKSRCFRSICHRFSEHPVNSSSSLCSSFIRFPVGQLKISRDTLRNRGWRYSWADLAFKIVSSSSEKIRVRWR